MPEVERIQKRLSNAGFGSRREIEEWIRQGRITVNGKVATLGERISLHDRIFLNGKPLRLEDKTDGDLKIIAYSKPAGIVCSNKDTEGRTTVFEKLPALNKGRWVNIGRLDINTTGLILFTNNGTLANRLMHPSGNIEREYAVRVLGTATEHQLQSLKKGVELDDGIAAFASIIDKGGEGANHWYHIVIKEGRNREVRRLWESQGLKVSRLIRVRYGPYQLPRNKRTGMCWSLSRQEVNKLLIAAGMDPLQSSRPPKSRGSRSARKPAKRSARKPTDKFGRKPEVKSTSKPTVKTGHRQTNNSGDNLAGNARRNSRRKFGNR